MIMPDASGKLRQDLTHFFSSRKIGVDVVLEVQDSSLALLLLQQGLGIAAVTEWSIRELLQRKELIVIGYVPGVNEELWLISGERKLENPAASHLMRHFSI